MMIYRRWVRVPPPRCLSSASSPAFVSPFRELVRSPHGSLPRRQVLFAFSDLFLSVRFFGTCNESSARASSLWLDSLFAFNVEYVTVSFVNSMRSAHSPRVSVCVWVFELRKLNSFITFHFASPNLHIIIRYFSLMHGASKRDCRSPAKKGVLCLVWFCCFFRLLLLRSASIIWDIEM